MKYQLKKYSNLPLSAYIEYKNGAIIKLYNKINTNILCNGTKQEIMQEYRKTLKGKFFKYVKISYTCDVFSTISNSWHFVDNKNYRCGYYNNVAEIKKIIDHVKNVNNEAIQQGILKNLKFNIKFIF